MTVQAQQQMSDEAREALRKAKADLDYAILGLMEAAAKVGRGPGGQEVSTAITNARTSTLWLESALSDNTGSLSAPSNHNAVSK